MKKIMLTTLIILLALYGFFWLASIKSYKVDYGISFSKEHAESLGLDWKQTYLAMLDELKPKYIRVSATWSETESEKGKKNSDFVDWQMLEAAKRGVKVTLVVGQKAPRWPECHVPGWANDLKSDEYKQAAKDYVKYVVERYRNHPALEIWQVENEPYIKFRFGECENFDESLVKEEIDLVHLLDKQRKIIITDSGELSTWISASRAGDIFGTTVYRIVMSPSGRYWKYDWLPAGFYKWKAKLFGRSYEDFFVSELQAEPWFNDSNPTNTVIEEQEKTMNPERLQKHLDFVQHIGASRAYLWGVEWWYWMKEKQGDERYWDVIRARQGIRTPDPLRVKEVL